MKPRAGFSESSGEGGHAIPFALYAISPRPVPGSARERRTLQPIILYAALLWPYLVSRKFHDWDPRIERGEQLDYFALRNISYQLFADKFY